ncbi:DUF1045 domain-containing protein [uncultured Roseobacter sp.]|uniref:DUF1045 domain-containing protein n=1 Tax=uncultured Roseobacter sp. TaxID=114847 RepID=UPI002605DFA7|nr:DUF1045 domain-containing protein [uncultured Roseobacter sp.]
MNFTRYAIYYTAPPGEFAHAGATWLGWDIATGLACDPVAGPAAERPGKYGFHGTIKPPFALADGMAPGKLQEDARAFCARLPPVRLQGLHISVLGRFLALTPVGPTDALAALAADVVRGLDPWRKPPTEAELDKRRRPGMSAVQEQNLTRWGYPYVLDAFRFHMTLTGLLDAAGRQTLQDQATAHFRPALPAPLVITDLSLCGEREDGRFQEICRLPLAG